MGEDDAVDAASRLEQIGQSILSRKEEEAATDKSTRGIVRRYLTQLEILKGRGLTWQDVAEAMDQAGIKNIDGTAFDGETVRLNVASIKSAAQKKARRPSVGKHVLPTPVLGPDVISVSETLVDIPPTEVRRPIDDQDPLERALRRATGDDLRSGGGRDRILGDGLRSLTKNGGEAE